MQLDGSYPTVTNELALCVKLEPVTVIDWPTGPVVGLLVIEGGGAVTLKVLLLVRTGVLLPLDIRRHTTYWWSNVAAAVGQLNVLVNPPEVIVTLDIVGEALLQLDVSYARVPEPLKSVALQLLSAMPEAVTLTDVPTGPDAEVGLVIENVGVAHAAFACAGKAAPQQSAISANTSTAEHRISAMLVEKIFDRVTPAFMLPSPKDRADLANKIVSPI